MIYNKDYNYEISIWTLQDSFVTVLKPSDLECNGWIQDDSIELNVDGTQNLSFSIPMYLYNNGVQQENPIWYNVTDGNLIANMRKIKVIINKNLSAERVLEFLITKVTERHESDQLYCDVEGEGLAFHELGKIGYKISLTSQDFYNDDMDWFNKEKNKKEPEPAPIANLQYWLAKASIVPYNNKLSSTTWGYEISMDWGFYNQEDNPINREYNKIYEEAYPTWKINNNEVVLDTIAPVQEKARLVDIEESNIYNITQKLAETFGVFCKYEYIYDDNYHIIGRKIVFYNNFINEKDGYIDLTYPYTTDSIKRNIDSTDLITKMYVRPAEIGSNSDIVTIMDVPANKGLEDYVLNFDYLYSIGTITKDQYDEIEPYKEKLHKINSELNSLDLKINKLKQQVPEIKATITTLTNTIKMAQENINQSHKLYEDLTLTSNGVIKVNGTNPDTAILQNEDEENKYYIKIKNTGIKPETLKIYKSWDPATKALSNPITGGSIEYDEFGGVIGVKNLYITGNTSKIIYLTYSYNPATYYDTVEKVWSNRLEEDSAKKKVAESNLTSINTTIDEHESNKEEKIIEKKSIIESFNKMMGPALREGYWQPENYKDYNSHYMDTLATNISNYGNSKKSYFSWVEAFKDEQLPYYVEGVNENEKYYWCINLKTCFNDRNGNDQTTAFDNIKKKIDEFSFIFYDYASGSEDNRNMKVFSVGSQCQVCYVSLENTDSKIPVLLLTGIKDLTDTQIENMAIHNNSYLGKIVTSSTDSSISIQEGYNILKHQNVSNHKDEINTNAIFQLAKGDKIYFPRIIFDDLGLKTSSDQLGIQYNKINLEPYKDYYILTRNDKYYITIKPEVLVKNAVSSGENKLDINFTISNASTAVYLDALQVLKENAYPKVSYEISPTVVDDTYFGKTYTMLNRIVNINDTKMKFENVQGYVSKVVLQLSKPWEDEIEIKNYRNKFEDLFSTIVAQTEEMKKNSNLLSAIGGMIMPDGTLAPEVLENTFYNNKSILQAYLDAGFDTSIVVENKLTEVFNAAGELLSGVVNGARDLGALNAKNAGILAGFYENVQENLTPSITRSATPPENFKEGDIWIQTDESGKKVVARYVCTTSRSKLINYNSAGNNGFYDGWTKVSDGRLAQITGAGVQVDAETGTIDLLAKNTITLGSGDIDIIGERSVNIGGTQINIGSVDDDNDDEDKIFGGINLVATKYNAKNFKDTPSVSKVLISPSKIEMASSDIEMKAGNGIAMYASDSDNTAALKINKDEGIWFGSTQGINFFSAEKNPNLQSIPEYDTTGKTRYTKGEIVRYNGKYYESKVNAHHSLPTNSERWKEISPNEAGASVSINSDKILFGVTAEGSNSTVVEMTEDHIILGATADSYTTLKQDKIEISPGNSGTAASGVKITSNSIGLAVDTSNGRTMIAMNGTDGITLASGSVEPSTHEGSYVQIKPTGIDIGSMGNLYVNTANVKLQTKPENEDGQSETLFALGTDLNNTNLDPKLVFDSKGNLTITGNIKAESLTLVNNEEMNEDLVQYIENLNKKIDDKIQTWFGKGTPTTASENDDTVYNDNIREDNGQTIIETQGKAITKGIILDPPEEYTDWEKDTNITYQKNGNYIIYKNAFYLCQTLHRRTVSPTPGSNSKYWKFISEYDPTGKNDDLPYWLSTDNDKHIGDIYYDIAETKEQARISDWTKGRVYKKGDIVRGSVSHKYFESQSDNNTSNLPSTSNTSWGSPLSLPIVYTYSETAGQTFRFVKNGNTYEWQSIENTITVSTAERMERIRNGEVGLAFSVSDSNSFVTLNKADGLVIMGEKQTAKDANGNILKDENGKNIEYYPFFKATNNAMGFFRTQNPTPTVINNDDKLLYFENGELIVKGNITAKSFILSSSSDYTKEVYWIINTTSTAYTSTESETNWKNWSTIAPNLSSNKGKYLHTKTVTKIGNQPTTTYDVSYIPEDGTTLNTEIKYAASTESSNPNSISSNSWKSDYNQAKSSWNANNPYLWTKTTIGTASSYSVSYYTTDGTNGTNGKDGKFVTKITPLYFLNNDETVPSISGLESAGSPVTSTSTNSGIWTTAIPEWKPGYYYFRCEQYEWSEGNPTWSNPYIDWGITTANQTATSASTKATNIVSYLNSAFNVSYNNGVFSNYEAPWSTTENPDIYEVALTSNKGMFIGSGSRLVIANGNSSTSAAAIVMDNSGIALDGTSINFTARDSKGNPITAVSLNKDGLDLGTSGTLNIGSGALKIDTSQTDDTNRFKIDTTNPMFYIGNKRTFNNSDYAIMYSSNGLQVKGKITATSGKIGGWTLENNILYSNSGKIGDLKFDGTGMSANTIENKTTNKSYDDDIYGGAIKDKDGNVIPQPGFYAFWAGADDPGEAPFRVTRNGEVFIQKLIVKEVTGKDNNDQDIYSIGSYNLSGDINSTNSQGGGGASGWVATQANLNEQLKFNATYGNKSTNKPDDKIILTPTFKGTPIQSKIVTFTLEKENDSIKLNNNKNLTIIPEFSISKHIGSDLTAKFTPLTAGSYDSEKQKIIFDGRIVIGYNEVNEEDPAGEPTWTTLKTFDKEDIQVSYTDNSTINSSFDIYLAKTETYTPLGTNIEEERTVYTKISNERNKPTPVNGTEILYIRNGNQENDTSSEAYYIQSSGTTEVTLDSLVIPAPEDINDDDYKYELGGTGKVLYVPIKYKLSNMNESTFYESTNNTKHLAVDVSLAYNAGVANAIDELGIYVYTEEQNETISGNTDDMITPHYDLLTTSNNKIDPGQGITLCIGNGSNYSETHYRVQANEGSSTGGNTIYYKPAENVAWRSATDSDGYYPVDGAEVKISLDNGNTYKTITALDPQEVDDFGYYFPDDEGNELLWRVSSSEKVNVEDIKFDEDNTIRIGWNNYKKLTISLGDGGNSQGGGEIDTSLISLKTSRAPTNNKISLASGASVKVSAAYNNTQIGDEITITADGNSSSEETYFQGQQDAASDVKFNNRSISYYINSGITQNGTLTVPYISYKGSTLTYGTKNVTIDIGESFPVGYLKVSDPTSYTNTSSDNTYVRISDSSTDHGNGALPNAGSDGFVWIKTDTTKSPTDNAAWHCIRSFKIQGSSTDTVTVGIVDGNNKAVSGSVSSGTLFPAKYINGVFNSKNDRAYVTISSPPYAITEQHIDGNASGTTVTFKVDGIPKSLFFSGY